MGDEEGSGDGSSIGHRELRTDVYTGVVPEEPVDIGDVLELKVEKVLESGRGEAMIKDKNGRQYPIFVEGDNLRAGQTVKVSITELMGGFAVGIAHSGNW